MVSRHGGIRVWQLKPNGVFLEKVHLKVGTRPPSYHCHQQISRASWLTARTASTSRGSGWIGVHPASSWDVDKVSLAGAVSIEDWKQHTKNSKLIACKCASLVLATFGQTEIGHDHKQGLSFVHWWQRFRHCSLLRLVGAFLSRQGRTYIT